MKKPLLIITFLVLVVLTAVVVLFFSTVGYLGPKSPNLDHEAEFENIAAQIYAGPVGDWAHAQALFDEFEQATIPGDSRPAAQAFKEFQDLNLEFPTIEQEAQALGPWATGLDSARFNHLAKEALENRVFDQEYITGSGLLMSCRRLTRALRLDARHAIASGESAEAIEAIQAALHLARICDAQPTILSRLVAAAVDAIAARLTFELISSRTATPEQLRSLSISFEVSIPADPTLTLESEWVWANLMFDAKYGESILIPQSRSAQLFKLREAYDKMIQEVQAGTNDRAWWDEYQDSLTPMYVPVDILLPAYGKFRSSLRQALTTRDAVRIALAIELHIAANGAPPQTLDQLVPEFLPEIPTDSVSGESFVYRITTTSPPGYTLYSIGNDAKDDNAQVINPERPYDALGSRRPGDAVFIPYQRPRPKSSDE